jgi:FkbM family methyltransferase
MIKSLQYLIDTPYYQKVSKVNSLYRFLVWKLIRAFKVKNYDYRIWDNRKVKLNYNSVQCMWLMYHYWVDWEEYNLIKDVLRTNDTVFDVGANIGLYSLWISKYNQEGKVYSFEPDPTNHQLFLKHISLNAVDKIVMPNKLGISDRVGSMFLSQGNDVQNHISMSTENSIEIPVTTLDAYCQQHSIESIRYLKIDIEGFELSALKGARTLLQNGKVDIIQLEINNALGHSGITANEVVDFLESFEYQLCLYNVEKKELEKVKYNIDRENYFAVKNPDKLNKEIIENKNH